MASKEPTTPEIYYHVGTSKTGTTFLQDHIFPFFKGLHYAKGKRTSKALPYIKKTGFSRYLISDEFDRQFEREITKIAQNFPQITPIIVFRRHDSYIASQYRRFVKNGYQGNFKSFLDIENDKGYFKIKHLDYNYQIEYLSQKFENKPVVLFYEDLRADAKEFIKSLAKRIGATVAVESLNLNPKHTSYNEKQLKGIKALGRYVNLEKKRIFKSNLLHFLWRLGLGSVRYSVLFIAKHLPERFYSSAPLIAPTELAAVEKYFAQDWQKAKAYAAANS